MEGKDVFIYSCKKVETSVKLPQLEGEATNVSDQLLRNSATKHCVINVILTKCKKGGCNTFYSCDNSDTDITKLGA